MEENGENKKKIGAKQIVCWVCGIFFVLCGLITLANGNVLSGVVVLIGGALLIPPVTSILQEKANMKPMITLIIAVVIILVGMMLSGGSDDETEDTGEASSAASSVATESEAEAESSVVVEAEESATVSESSSESAVSSEDGAEEDGAKEDGAAEETETHIYDDAEVIDVMNGYRTEKVGEMSLIRAESSDVTEEALADWYYNYVTENDFNYCLILYIDIENMGCYSISGMVEVNVTLEDDGYGVYTVGDSSESILYLPEGDGVLKVYEDEDEESTTETNTSSPTIGEADALSRAKEYLSVMAFSYSGLVEQLEYEGYSNAEATYAADNCGADWNEQAAAKAEEYLSVMSFSRSGLIEQLEYEGFTTEQAEYGATAVGY